MHTRKLLPIAAVVLAGAASAMCVPDRVPTPAVPDEPLTAAQVAAVTARSRLTYHGSDVHWVADLHTRAMQDWMGQRRRLGLLSRADACARVGSLALSFTAEVQRASSRPAAQVAQVYRRAVALARDNAGCGAAALPLAIWRVPVAPAQDADTIVSEAFEAYALLLESVVTAAASPAEVTAGANAVLAQAAALPAPDYEMVAAMATLAASSSWYWYEYEGQLDTNQEPMAIFGQEPSRFRWRLFAAADLAGGVAVVKTLRSLGVSHPFLLIGSFFGGAAVGSAMYAYDHAQ